MPSLETFKETVVDLMKDRKLMKLSLVTTCEPSRRKAMSIVVTSVSDRSNKQNKKYIRMTKYLCLSGNPIVLKFLLTGS